MILGIYGAGGNGKTAVDLANVINNRSKRWDRIVFIDDVINEKTIYGVDVYTFEESVRMFSRDEISYVISNGEPSDREMLYNRLKELECRLETLINPDAWVPEGTIIGEGCILALCSIGSDTIIENNVVISQDALIGHDTKIGANTNISAGAFVAGHCNIGKNVYIGPRAVLRDRIDVEENAVVALGAVVFKDVPGTAIAIGNPAKHIKKEDGFRIFG